jgi:hypothetical protein
MFDYIGNFQSAIAALKRERRYRVFADLERKAGQFKSPAAARSSTPSGPMPQDLSSPRRCRPQ